MTGTQYVTAATTGIEIAYETFGDTTDPPVILIIGYSSNMRDWDDPLCRLVAQGGRWVIRFDNRDAGLSSKLDGVSADSTAYTLSDMALDVVGLLDALAIPAAHIVGGSMGGMIAQTFAIEHPERTLTLTSMMSNTGEPGWGDINVEAAAALTGEPPATQDEYVARAELVAATFGAPRVQDLERVRTRAADIWDGGYSAEGAARQMMALVTAPPRGDGLRALDVPTLVIHGRDDPLLPPSGGQRTAELVPGAHFLLLADCAHELPPAHWRLIAGAVVAHTATA